MATKPAIADTRFGVNGADADAANVAAPTSGQRDTGWVTNQVPTSTVENYMKNRSYRWFQYLDAVFTAGGAAVGDMKLSGGASFGGGLAVTGGATVGGNQTVGGTLGVTGLITATSGVTAAANQHVTVSGTGEIKHGVREFGVSSMGFAPAFVLGTDVSMDGSRTSWNFGAATIGSITLVADLEMRIGDRITSIVWVFSKGSNAAALTMRLSSVNGAALTKTTRDSLADVTSGAGVVSVPRSSINYTVVTGDNMRLEVLPGNTAHQFSHCHVFYDRP
jgi:hypothetical protein